MQFKVPLQSEIARYMKDKMGWPDAFCEYYADKFWNFYQSNGWKVSGKAPMKDWKAAFNSNWKELKWEAAEKLAKFQVSRKPLPAETELKYMQDRFKEGSVDPSTLLKWYDLLKTKGVMRLPTEVINQIRMDAGNNNDKAKILAVKEFLKPKLRIA